MENFHSGEIEAQLRAGGGPRGTAIRDFMPDQHRDFFALLPFALAATTDETGAPVATILAGKPGFVAAPDPHFLTIAALPDADDPAASQFIAGAEIGLLGIDLATRRRNRVNGVVTDTSGGLTIMVEQSFGNCPKYIHRRAWTEIPAGPHRAPTTERLAGLDAAARRQIGAADTFFIATTGGARTGDGADISHRGGPAGFVSVAGNVLTIPDYRGNRYFNTFGNLLRDGRAALLFPDFATGDVLHLQGRAAVSWSTDDSARLLRFEVTSGWRRIAAVPIRWHELDD
jgi:predicted pyridoxine 5'-phosphate oxidase superfamily flavin-nucleotide-binding protein